MLNPRYLSAEPGRVLSRSALRLAAFGLMLGLTTSCALPFVKYPVSPELNGQLDAASAGATLELSILSSAGWIGADEEAVVASDGGFHFDRIAMRVAGLEVDQRYRASLNLRGPGGEHRTIWRAEWFRADTGRAVTLDCNLERSTEHGQPCWVNDPTQHAWLVQLGKLEFLGLCSSCHGVGAVGEGTSAAGLAPPPPDLRRIAARRDGNFDRVAILAWIDGRNRTTGHWTSEMPVWGPRLSRELGGSPNPEDTAAAKLDAIVTYLESVQRRSDEGS
jgi:mono/diheme cytochrome c family protein